jgi:hypothetical protein
MDFSGVLAALFWKKAALLLEKKQSFQVGLNRESKMIFSIFSITLKGNT